MLTSFLLAFSLQAAPHEELHSDLTALGELISVGVHCDKAGYRVDFEPAHLLDARLKARAAELGLSEEDATNIVSAGWERQDALFPPRNLPEDFDDNDFLASLDKAQATWPRVCRQLATNHPEMIRIADVDDADRDLKERFDLYRRSIALKRALDESQ
ncbi:hypothetical protein [Brevundimonas vesicularis]|uniref:hypothetical protein n=1 Tax=Brevundimonas vesicularis TaxID=41276 RepID=UPI0028AFE3DB|nr:hypothetical protein [Brevundimonas vesicularis]